MKSFRSKPVGWANDNYRHYLAAKYGSAGHKYFFKEKQGEVRTRMFVEGEEDTIGPFFGRAKYPYAVSDSPELERLKLDVHNGGEFIDVENPETGKTFTVYRDDNDPTYGIVESEAARRLLNKYSRADAKLLASERVSKEMWPSQKSPPLSWDFSKKANAWRKDNSGEMQKTPGGRKMQRENERFERIARFAAREEGAAKKLPPLKDPVLFKGFERTGPRWRNKYMYTPAFVAADLPLIAADGIGTAGAATVEFIPIAVPAVLAYGGYKYWQKNHKAKK